MDKRMLINSIHPEECRIAIVEKEVLLELEVESLVHKKLKGNVYKGRVSRIEPSLQAAFIDIGTERNGFLQSNDIHPSCYRDSFNGKRPLIQEVLSHGQDIIVQVVKEERDQKGATLTTYLSLPGRYIVLMPGSERGGVSRKISDVDQRARLKNVTQDLELPAGMGVIVRTAGLDRSQSELSRDLSLQLRLWEQIIGAAQNSSAPQILFKENDLATRVIRDYFTPDIREIIIDETNTFQKVKEFIGLVMPRYRSRVKLHEKETPLFSEYSIEQQIAQTLSHEVTLPSGGAIVIDTLEALVAIDVNSGKSTSGGSIEDTAFRTNLEAADEIARQIRLRDLGGLLVVDFIDMSDSRNRAAVEKCLRTAVKDDKARIEIGSLSKFGLLEMSRQRLRASISSQSHVKCSHCEGTGSLRASESVALDALRKMQTAIVGGGAQVVKARLAPAPALFLLNSKRAEISHLETAHKARILIVPDARLKMSEHEFEIGTASSMSQSLVVQSSRAEKRPTGLSSSSGALSRSKEHSSTDRAGSQRLRKPRPVKPSGKLEGRRRSKQEGSSSPTPCEDQVTSSSQFSEISEGHENTQRSNDTVVRSPPISSSMSTEEFTIDKHNREGTSQTPLVSTEPLGE
jgi:ribonuclease E